MKTKFVKQLAQVLADLKSESEAVDFLQGILTPQELDEISTRLQIVKMLKEGVAQRMIAEKLGVGIATVTRGSAEIKKGRFKHV